MNFGLLILTVCIILQTSSGDSQLSERCCGMGKSLFHRRRESCPPHIPALSELSEEEKEFCNSLIHVCCLELLKDKLCADGAQIARNRNSCNQLNSRVDMEDSRECCHCCNLGIITARRGMPCQPIGQIINSKCESNFVSCCNITSLQTTTRAPQRSCNTITTCQHICVEESTGPKCACFAGYTLDFNARNCIDVDECQMGRACAVNEICENTPGSFHCRRNLTLEPQDQRCALGFTFNHQTNRCEDVNECAMNKDNCLPGQTCENTVGSFHCLRTVSCGTGYTLDQPTQECLDDDECSLGIHNCGPAWDCINLPGSFRCIQKTCSHGYKLNTRTGSCETIICPIGLKPDSNGECIDINECTEVPNACGNNQQCRNLVGSYSCQNMLNCGSGYISNEERNECEDINECETFMHECTGYLMQCINLPGSYSCKCPDGFRINQNLKTCEDVDECRSLNNVCALNARCENTHGSYRCQCKEGFEMAGGICRDIDECQRPGMCHHTCRNTWGSFRCECREGFQIAVDNRMCEDIDECTQAAQNNIKLCLGICENNHGSFACTCPPGYRLSSDMRTCEDVDECLLRTAQCHNSDEICINTRGGYKCQMAACPDRFIKSMTETPLGVKCQRTDYICPQGDLDCTYAPISVSIYFLSFPSQIRVPTPFFHMKGPQSLTTRLVFTLDFIKATDPITGESRVNRGFFNIETESTNEVFLHLLRRIEGPQDVELEVKMTIYSRDFQARNQEQYYGTAVAKIFLYVTKDPWQ